MKPDEKTVKLFENDRFATENGAVIEEVEEHYAQCSLKLGSRHRNAMGAVMGGVYFTLADFAFAVAGNGNSVTSFRYRISWKCEGQSAYC
mgnify:CR=1 FL=1